MLLLILCNAIPRQPRQVRKSSNGQKLQRLICLWMSLSITDHLVCACVLVVSQERELLGRITELQEEVSRRKNHIAQLDLQIHTLNENISTLTKELELKGKEVLKIRSEANQQIRYDSALRGATQLHRRAVPKWNPRCRCA